MYPNNGAKSTVAKYCAELNMAAAVPVSLVGNQATVILLFAGNAGASAIPKRNLKINSTTTAIKPAKKPVNPVINVKKDHTKRLIAYIFLDPKRSKSHPPGSWARTYDQPNAEKIYPIDTESKCKLLANAGPAIESTVRSA